MFKKPVYIIFISLAILFTACVPIDTPPVDVGPEEDIAPVPATPDQPLPTPLPTREPYFPGTLVDYTAQTGDTLTALAVRFNTTIEEIREANPIIPGDATTMPPGMPMKIPIYYQSLWGSPYHIIPDSLFINGPAQKGFDIVAFVDSQPGWLKNYSFYLGNRERRGGEAILYISTLYSVSPRLLLALLEYHAGALSNPETPASAGLYTLGYRSDFSRGAARQLIWAANLLNNAYYSWRTGSLTIFDLLDGRSERPDPWQNAASVALHYYFSKLLPREAYEFAISGEGFQATYAQLFGDPWQAVEPHIPGSLTQPALLLPFQGGKTWAYTGGPHSGWGAGEPYAALDFAPPSVAGGCSPSEEPVTALADGMIVRIGDALAVLDLDGDGDERTGWVVLYLHLANDSLLKVGKMLKAGDPIGMPSCEGGTSTGTHVHIARKYNGEWIPAGGALAFNLEGWVAQAGSVPYQGSLVRNRDRIEACVCSDFTSHITAILR